MAVDGREADERGGENRTTKKDQISSNREQNGQETQNQTPPISFPTQQNDGFTIHFHISYLMCGLGTLFSILVAIFAVFLFLVLQVPKADTEMLMREVRERSGKAGVDLFRSYDLNRDGYLSVREFEPLIPHLKNLTSMLDEVMPIETFLDYTPEDGEEVLVVHADFTPLKLDTMTQQDILNMDITGKSTLFGLRNWTTPNMRNQMFGASEFRSLLPDDLESLELGQVYDILEPVDTGLFGNSILSSSRYYPVKPKDKKEKALYRLLGMMHLQPFIQMRFPPRGTVACVRALSDRYVHIVFRMHAEFQLNQPPLKPFWYTPAQFLGDLVMSRDGTHVHYFHLEVPKERRLNVDMEWLTGQGEADEGMEVDIGFMPLMEWTISAESELPAPELDSTSHNPDLSTVRAPDQMVWTSESPREDCLRKIEQAFYPFKQVTYHNLTQAVKLSRQENKPLHAVFLWGALDDQSC